MSSEGLSLEDEIEKEIENFQIDSDEDSAIMKEKDDDDFVSDSINVATNSLLRATICELERALKDTRRLLLDRDKDNGALRQELERTRKDLRREQSQRRRSNEETEKKLSSYNDIVKINEQMKVEIEELRAELEGRRIEKDDEADEIVPCCSSMNDLITMRQKVKDIEKEFEDFKANNQIQDNYSISSFKNRVNLVSNPAESNKQAQKELQTQLRIKFLRDAFFYYMIDFHPDEQMKAILAILDYDDKRHDIILESHRMKRQGKKFIVSEVSSRSLTFVQEHNI